MAETWTSTGHGCILVFGANGTDSAAAPDVIQALTAIARTPCGLELIHGITNSRAPAGEGGYKVKIYTPATVAHLPRISYFSNRCVPTKTSIPSRSAVLWDPKGTEGPGGIERPPFIGLAHELIHAYHYANGVAKEKYEDEEEFTIGLIPYALENITENKIRTENNESLRTSRGDEHDALCDDVKEAIEEIYKRLNA